MTANLGTVDRLVRLVTGLALMLAPTLLPGEIWNQAIALYGAYTVGIVLMATAGLRFCPLYRLFGLRTCGA